MSIPTPRQDPAVWQVGIGTIAVKESVLRVQLTSLETPANYDRPKANGRNGATIKFQGLDLATFTIRLVASSAEGLNVLRGIVRYIREATVGPATATDLSGINVVHPLLADANVTSMVVENIKLEFTPDQYVAELSCVQWAAAPKSIKSVSKKIDRSEIPESGDVLNTSKKPQRAPPPKPWEQPIYGPPTAPTTTRT